MTKGIPLNELTPETREKLKLGDTDVSHRIVILGRVLQSLEGLTKRDALWVLRTGVNHLKGYRERAKRA